MAGELEKIIGLNGQFDADDIDDLEDAVDALEECFKVIVELSDEDMDKVSDACYEAGVPDPYCDDRPENDPMPAKMRREKR